ncbi:hypothetical protein D3C80_674770 [compost metagenome]
MRGKPRRQRISGKRKSHHEHLHQFHHRNRRGRHRPHHLGHARQKHERLHRRSHGRTRSHPQTDHGRRCDQGRRLHQRQIHLLRRRGSHHDPRHVLHASGRACERPCRRRAKTLRCRRPHDMAVPRYRNERQALGRRHQRHLHGRRIRAVARLPRPRRVECEVRQAGAARGQGRHFPRRRRHPTRVPPHRCPVRPADDDHGSVACACARQGHGPRPSGRRTRSARHRRKTDDQGWPETRRPLG